MKTFENFESILNASANAYKSTNTLRKALKKEYYSLSKVLRDFQSKSFMPLTSELFEAIGLPTDGKVKPSFVLDMLQPQQITADKNNNLQILLWRRCKVYEINASGEKVQKVGEDGLPVFEDRANAIKDGTWTLDKVVLLVIQAKEFAKENAK